MAGWLNREQQKVLYYLREENRVLREQLDKKPIRFTDSQRRRLAAKGKELSRSLLAEFGGLVTPDTIMRWHRKLIAKKWTYPSKNKGHPRLSEAVQDLIVKMAKENPTWGYKRIQGALKNLAQVLSPNTVKNVLLDHGIDPAPQRTAGMPWSKFLKAHWSTLAASDFFSTEVWTPSGLKTIYTLFFIRLESREVEIFASTEHPNTIFMNGAAMDITDEETGCLKGVTHLIIDRDTKYTKNFKESLLDSGTECVVLPPRSQNLNAFAERFVKSIKYECLKHMIFFGQRSLERAIKEIIHYNTERNHQGLGNELMAKRALPKTGEIQTTERLGGMLNYYSRKPA